MYSRYLKRMGDFIVALIMLLTFMPLLVIIFMGYLITWNFPIFFFQQRTGKNKLPFTMYKFRTLSMNEQKQLHERRFVLGDFLRATSLDELPQLINVLKGEMSLIGPRPLPVNYLQLLNEKQCSRFAVLPGITGWTQVNGRHDISWAIKFELDSYYVSNISFWLDLIIACKTLFVLLSFKRDISLEEKPFAGS